MTDRPPRLRMLAGPNGSGKSSLVPRLAHVISLGTSINADEIEKKLRTSATLPFAEWHLYLTEADLTTFSSLPDSQRLPVATRSKLQLVDNSLLFSPSTVDSYLAAWVAELLRYQLLQVRQSMLFETVMSHRSKVDFLAEARAQGYRTYLYYVATADPLINLERVAARVAKGGHPVAPAKVIERYYRSLELLVPAIKQTDRAYIFDNSLLEPQLIAEITDGQLVKYQLSEVPRWVVEVLGR